MYSASNLKMSCGKKTFQILQIDHMNLGTKKPRKPGYLVLGKKLHTYFPMVRCI